MWILKAIWAFCARELLQKDGFEGGGEFGLSGEFFGELSKDSRTVKVTAGAKAGVAIEQEGGERFVRGEAVVNEGCEHLLITQIRLYMLVGCRAWIC